MGLIGCTCFSKNEETDYNAVKENPSLFVTNDGIKLKSGIKNRRNLLMNREKIIEDLNNFRNEVLDIINIKRKIHGVGRLEMNSQLNDIAQKFAEELSYINQIDYSGNKYQGFNLGESIYQSFKKITAEKLVSIWYDESSEFNFGINNPEPSHFSQMVWKSTKLFGLGVAIGNTGNYFFVANYYPEGNIPGKFTSNVFDKSTIESNDNILKRNNHNNLEISNTTKSHTNYNSSNYLYNSNSNNNFKSIKNNNNYNSKNINEGKASNSNDDYNSFCFETLQSHNKYRKIHHSPPLSLNKEICQISQKYAENLANNDIFQHSDNKYKGEELGENLFMCKGKEATGEYVTKSWYDEIKDHDFNGGFQNNTGHFTQLVWKGSKEVGFGFSKSKSGYTYVVANYFPAGNFSGQFRANVLKP